jgi:hypothetical protein
MRAGGINARLDQALARQRLYAILATGGDPWLAWLVQVVKGKTRKPDSAAIFSHPVA